MMRILAALLVVFAAGVEAASPEDLVRMVFVLHADPKFRDGLEQVGLSGEAGFRFINTGFDRRPFRERWADLTLLNEARASGLPYYIDRITGGMPYQPLDGIGVMAKELKDNANFLGFQVHEWGNSPLHDYHRIHRLILSKGKPLDAEQFAQYEGRTRLPFFSGGNFETYETLYSPLKRREEVETYLGTYFKRMVALTHGQVVSVTGHRHLYHTALRLGAKNVMAEVGNQVCLTGLQVACVRGAAREYGKPFGLYYETWGGKPFGCVCATDFSPWFVTPEQLKDFTDMGSVGPQFGSSRSLQRRLLFFGWLSGASYWAEEWGAENVFTNWDEHPLTPYGQIMKDFVRATKEVGPIAPTIPAALVLPPDTFGIDGNYVAGRTERLYNNLAEPDNTHKLLRKFATQVYATQPKRDGGDAHNLTPSPWIGSFDVLSGEASPDLLSRYAVLVFLDAEQAKATALQGPKIHVFTGDPAGTARCLEDVNTALPFQVQGEVGSVQARSADGRLVGIFNNLGVTKTDKSEALDPEAVRTATITGPSMGMSVVYGEEHVRETSNESVKLALPAGAVAVLFFAE